MKHRGYGFIEFEISNSTISTVFRQPLNHVACSQMSSPGAFRSEASSAHAANGCSMFSTCSPTIVFYTFARIAQSPCSRSVPPTSRTVLRQGEGSPREGFLHVYACVRTRVFAHAGRRAITHNVSVHDLQTTSEIFYIHLSLSIYIYIYIYIYINIYIYIDR